MKYWIGVISLAHTEIAVESGICQFNHGKRSPLDRMSTGDHFTIYSPKETIKGGAPIQAFTAIGEVLPTEVYQVEYNGFKPFRRDALYFESSHALIRPYLEELDFTKGKKASWGQVLRRGFFEVSEKDFELIAKAMNTNYEDSYTIRKGLF
jgi:hypothetical protein